MGSTALEKENRNIQAKYKYNAGMTTITKRSLPEAPREKGCGTNHGMIQQHDCNNRHTNR